MRPLRTSIAVAVAAGTLAGLAPATAQPAHCVIIRRRPVLHMEIRPYEICVLGEYDEDAIVIYV